MGQVITKNGSSAFADAIKTTTNFFKNIYVWLKSTQFMYQFFARQAPLDATIISATLTVYNYGSWAGSNTLTMKKVLVKWSASSLTFKNKPAVGATSGAVTKGTTTAANTPWVFDVTADMQEVSNGGIWWGWRFEVGGSSDRRIWTSKGTVAYRPTLEVVWALNPAAPDVMYPSGGRAVTVAKPFLRVNFVDPNADAVMTDIRVQINTVEDMTAPAFDLSTPNSTGLLQLVNTAYAGLGLGAIAYWRAQVKDSAGLWSDWSRVESFTRIALGTVAITLPAVAPNDYVEESSPPLDWTFSGVQKSYRVFIEDLAALGIPIWDSGKITSDILGLTPPDNTLKIVNHDYRETVQVWDDQNREANVEPAYAQASRDFTYELVGSVTPVSDLTLTKSADGPWVKLSWTIPTPPDFFDIYRDGQPLQSNFEPSELLVSGTSYEWWDLAVPPRTEHSWKVLPKVNSSVPNEASNPQVLASIRPNAAWISQLDGTNAIALFNYTPDLKHAQNGASKQVLGSDETVMLMGSRGGYQGTVSGRIASFAGVTADEFIERLESIRTGSNPLVYFTWANQCILAAIDSITYVPKPKTEEVVYDFSFALYERKSPV